MVSLENPEAKSNRQIVQQDFILPSWRLPKAWVRSGGGRLFVHDDEDVMINRCVCHKYTGKIRTIRGESRQPDTGAL
jgi:hypothetical protein